MATIAENIQTLRSIKSDIKNAITDKGGSVGNDFKTYAQAITNLPSGGGGGGTEIEDALVMGTLSGTYYNNRVSRVGNYAFYNCGFLTSINLPNCSYVRNDAFALCGNLTSISLPNCTSIESSAFYYCGGLPSIDLPLCTQLSGGVFYECQSLIYINIPNCKSIKDYAFYDCSNLSQVYLNSVTSVTTIQRTTFSNCPNLTSIYVPASLVNAFKTARYWSSISDKIVAYTEGEVGEGDIL